MTTPLGRTFFAGDRVVVSPDYHWARGATATVSHQGGVRNTMSGPVQFYVVTFDIPQEDGSGDGPYDMATIDSRFLAPILNS
jgi:hypothetical protein